MIWSYKSQLICRPSFFKDIRSLVLKLEKKNRCNDFIVLSVYTHKHGLYQNIPKLSRFVSKKLVLYFTTES